jgi:hypothetical protein
LRMNLMMEVIKMMMVGLISILFMQEQIWSSWWWLCTAEAREND